MQIVTEKSIQIPEIKDDDGFPCDDLQAIENWIKVHIQKCLDFKYDIASINFSTYGASLVHIDENGKPLTPLYNYLKHYPDEILYLFHEKYGDAAPIAKATGSPFSGMLNSGLQLFWLKHTKPEIYKKIKWSLHFPQYLSFLFTGKAYSDYTSVGCHTSLWDYEKKDYHDWVYQEGIHEKLAPIVASDTTTTINYLGKEIKFGVGVHDSSAALYPYILQYKKPFVLLSTGTWNVTLNPFNNEALTEKELENDCLNYMQVDGSAVRASRIFLGNEHTVQVQKLNNHFGKSYDFYRKIFFDEILFSDVKKIGQFEFRFESIPSNQELAETYDDFDSFELAYHRLMFELLERQIHSTKLAIGQSKVDTIFVEGGFFEE